MKEIKAPELMVMREGWESIFLAGSIEMGKAENWQDRVKATLADHDVYLLNPRRDDWDSSWVQSIDNPQFREQVEWELSALEAVDIILMYFDPKTKSPISLLELGLFADDSKLWVCCPKGFWRRGNIEIVCKRYNIPLFEDLSETIESVLYELFGGVVPNPKTILP